MIDNGTFAISLSTTFTTLSRFTTSMLTIVINNNFILSKLDVILKNLTFVRQMWNKNESL